MDGAPVPGLWMCLCRWSGFAGAEGAGPVPFPLFPRPAAANWMTVM